ncbi:hypothetical protein DRH13_01465 [Candidatus Woesebacteria bacterium]|nr:MAG: hypothetical protein DRH13_01465 [Candidatus Woesebacteria bacterium]
MSKERKPLLINREEFINNQILGFDHDGVLSYSRQPVVDEYNKQFGTNHSTDEIKGFNALAKWAEEDLGASREEAQEIHDYFWYKRPDILLRAKPMPGAEAITKELALRGKDFRIITSRPHTFQKSTLKWYRKNMPWISKDQIHIRTTDEMVGEIFKAWTIDHTGVTVFFEDAIHQAKYITTYTDATVVLLNNGPLYDIPNRDKIIKITSFKNRLPTLQEAEHTLFYG